MTARYVICLEGEPMSNISGSAPGEIHLTDLSAATNTSRRPNVSAADARPIPSFWNFIDDRGPDQFANSNHQSLKPMRHHA